MLIVTMIFLNLFIAVILQGFQDTSEAESLTVKESTVESFREVWSEFDESGEGFIPTSILSTVILRLVEVNSPLIWYKVMM